MKRACYCKLDNKKYKLRHVRSINKDGSIDTEPIPELSNDFSTLESMFIDANRKGYGVIGDLDELKSDNIRKVYRAKCGNNQMDIDEL